jgi:hypothetical protein
MHIFLQAKRTIEDLLSSPDPPGFEARFINSYVGEPNERFYLFTIRAIKEKPKCLRVAPLLVTCH